MDGSNANTLGPAHDRHCHIQLWPYAGLCEFGFFSTGRGNGSIRRDTQNSIQGYIVDAFFPYSASAMAVATAMRSIIGCILPLFSDSLFRHLGWGLGGTLLAAVAVPAIPAPLIMVRVVFALCTSGRPVCF
jgi:hypothetical protein